LKNEPRKTFALAGNPNCGKTTIFNALTGLRQKTGNYAGVTVEKRSGSSRRETGERVTLIDLPGTYSLVARSPDERIAVDVLAGRIPGEAKLDGVIVVIDASNLQRNLYLLSQFIETGLPVVVALNMMDIAERRGTRVQPEVLSQKLGVPVVPVVGHKGKGIAELKRALDSARPAREPDWPLPIAMRTQVDHLVPHVESLARENGLLPRAFAERLLVGEAPVNALSSDVKSRVDAARIELVQAGVEPVQADVEAHYKWIEELTGAVTQPVVDVRVKGRRARELRGTGVSPVNNNLGRDGRETKTESDTLTDTVDRFLLHKVWGLAVFAVIMGGIFVSIFWLADPIMGAVESSISEAGKWVAPFLPQGPLRDLWTDGIVAGVGGVLVFVPQIAILFAFLAILEDSGYLARAAFLMDRLLAKVGLSGKAFVPLLSSFACAIPGVMASRTIENRRDRLATIFVAPFMSCSARLPVYGLLIGTFFAGYGALTQGGILLAMYLIGVIAAFGTAWCFKKTLLKGSPASFILELPSYKVPQWSQVLRVVVTNTWQFLAKAGTIIFALSVVLWAMTYWPRLSDEDKTAVETQVAAQVREEQAAALAEQPATQQASREIDAPADWKPETTDEQVDADAEAFQKRVEKAVASEQLRHSVAGWLGHGLEPLIAPLGYDWKMGVGLVGAFAAREVFVSTMAIVYSAGDEEDIDPLATAMKADTYADGTKVWTPLVATSMLVWFVLAMQCLSTLAIVKRETGGWKWPILQLLYMNGLAYVVCLLIYQIGRMLGG
jgi:ferrous iron transport protein B